MNGDETSLTCFVNFNLNTSTKEENRNITEASTLNLDKY